MVTTFSVVFQLLMWSHVSRLQLVPVPPSMMSLPNFLCISQTHPRAPQWSELWQSRRHEQVSHDAISMFVIKCYRYRPSGISEYVFNVRSLFCCKNLQNASRETTEPQNAYKSLTFIFNKFEHFWKHWLC